MRHVAKDVIEDAASSACILLVTINLDSLEIRGCDLRLVVEHLLEVRNEPALIHGVAMEASGELVVDAALCHLAQSEEHHIRRFISPSALRIAEEEIVHDC